MTEPTDAREPEHLEIFDSAGDDLTCRVCGALVSSTGDYPQVHWDWHEAANGA